MNYTFMSLLPADFEDLARDLLGAELGVRFEGFTAGPAGGAARPAGPMMLDVVL